ncbi:MAG: carboxypeptidase regulatory-like domain-containing protein, partial [Euryarchaeota archaeon]|nr:carboxypeptidase regulatory-like domain-containing protein [Euryarchaeota archaeon]
MRPSVVVTILSLALLSGCVDSGGSEATDEAAGGASATADAGQNVDPGAEVGTLGGAVVDDELRPVSGVTVAIREPAVSALTDDAGRYSILNLPVGVYDVFADRLGYESRAAKVTIEAGKATNHDFTLVPLALDEAFIDYWHRTLIYDCLLFANPAWVSACSWPYTAVYEGAHNNGVNLSHYGAPPDIQDNQVRINFTVDFGIKGIVSELAWIANTESARRMMLAHCDPKEYDPVLDSCTSMGGGNAKGRTMAPSGLTVNSVTGNSVSLGWNDNSSNEWGFRLFRSLVSSGPYTLVADTVTLPAGTVSRTDPSLSAATTYYYYVVAVNAGGHAFSNNVSTQTSAGGLATPTNPVLNNVYVSSITASWDLVSGATGYTLAASTNSGASPDPVWTSSTTVGNGATTATLFENSPLDPNTTYYLFVRTNGDGESSAYSAAVATSTLADVPTSIAFISGDVNYTS